MIVTSIRPLVEVISFKSTGRMAIYVGGLHVGLVTKRTDGRLVVDNSCYDRYSFTDTAAVELFTVLRLNSRAIIEGAGIMRDFVPMTG